MGGEGMGVKIFQLNRFQKQRKEVNMGGGAERGRESLREGGLAQGKG